LKKARRGAGRAKLEQLLATNPLTEGMYVRTCGDHLIIGRHESFGPDGDPEADDRVRLTALNENSYGLSVRRHTGRWEKTPFTGTVDELVDVIWSLMQHIVAQYT
jgi:hypothetical protein